MKWLQRSSCTTAARRTGVCDWTAREIGVKRSAKTKSEQFEHSPKNSVAARAKMHLVVGWWTLLLFLILGTSLEALHAFKLGWYLNVGNEARRLMLTLAHAHGSLLALVNIALGLCLNRTEWKPGFQPLASRCLLGATVLLPGGFFLGGLYIYDGDPGLGVWLVPAGAFLMAVGVAVTAIAVTWGASPEESPDTSPRSQASARS